MKTFHASLYHLRDMIESVVLAAGKDTTLPTLCAIYFEWEKAGRLMLTSTDRYKLINATLPIDKPSDDGAFLLQKNDALALAKMLPKKPARSYGPDPHCIVELDGDKVTFSWTGGTAVFENHPGEFPKYQGLFPDKAVETDWVNINVAENLAFLAKIKTTKVWTFMLTGQNRAVLATAKPDMESDPSYRALIMPVRLV